MDFKPKNREWVKNAAIIFLLILLILTFFSNTILNRTLPQVGTQMVSSGSITAQVRGSGTVVANGSHNVKATETREIRAVMVKVGQEVNAGDVLFVLGAGDSEELEAAQESLRQLQVSYQRAALNVPTYDYTTEERKIEQAKEALEQAKAAEQAALDNMTNNGGVNPADLEQAKADLANAQNRYDEFSKYAEQQKQDAQARIDAAQARLDELLNSSPSATPSPDASADPDATADPAATPATTGESQEITDARKELADANAALATIISQTGAQMEAYQADVNRCQERLDKLSNAAGAAGTAYQEAVTARKAAEDALFELQYALDKQKQEDNKNQQLSYIDLSDIGAQIAKQQKKIRELSGGEENEITANVSGTVQSVECTAGDTKMKDDILCTIEVPDMGYTLSFSVTNEQARRLKPGDSATISNYYWGREITATLTTIATDPKNPQNNKLLTFDLEGDVTAGGELTVSVGSKSAGYETIVPNSSIRSDSNGSFVLVIEAKSSPLGNRYIARRVDVEVLAADDSNSAVTGALEYGDYVITTSNAPVNSGEQVRMADS